MFNLVFWLLKKILGRRYVLVTFVTIKPEGEVVETHAYKQVLYTAAKKGYINFNKTAVFLDNASQKEGEFRNGKPHSLTRWYDV